MTVEVLDRRRSRAQSLKEATRELHETLDRTMMAQEPFSHPERYGEFVELQYRFLAAVEPAYHDVALAGYFTDLPSRSRLAAARRDLEDLGRPVPLAEPVAIGATERIGWLYVAEGSTLGAAFLSKWAAEIGYTETFGARHLAGAPDGRARYWRAFTAELDALALTPEEDERAIAGAVAAFRYVQQLLPARAVPPGDNSS